ncbi:MAG TPA: hypothetical protein VHH52_10870 [Pseudonocardiaceae bacterium]|nr:hypothetical protein [Pseudonocardiaceae bacterium]
MGQVTGRAGSPAVELPEQIAVPVDHEDITRFDDGAAGRRA